MKEKEKMNSNNKSDEEIVSELLGELEYGKAIPILNKILMKKPNDIPTLLKLGESMIGNGDDISDCIEIYKKIIQINDKSLEAYVQLLECYKEIDEYQDAIATAEKIIKLAPKKANDIKKDIEKWKKLIWESELGINLGTEIDSYK
jgi:tetratricopeptide (TPR) repeat protein